VLVDVIIPAWNAAATIERSVRSALEQTVPTRVIVVDDASTDDTFAVARAIKDDERLVVLRQDRNLGPAAARNAAIARGDSPWIALLDADDHLAPDRIAAMLALADDADLIADDPLMRDDGAPDATAVRLLGPRHDGQVVGLAAFVSGNIPTAGAERRELGLIKPLMRRAFLTDHDLHYDTQLRLGEDYDLYARALAAGARLRLLPPLGYHYVRRSRSLSAQHSIGDLQRLRDVDTRLLDRPGLSRDVRAALKCHRESTDKRLQWRLLIEAVKQRRLVSAVATFGRSPAVSLYLIGQLWEQVLLRSGMRRPEPVQSDAAAQVASNDQAMA
jgi:succinoglycan biosynthesis protein ExoU